VNVAIEREGTILLLPLLWAAEEVLNSHLALWKVGTVREN